MNRTPYLLAANRRQKLSSSNIEGCIRLLILQEVTSDSEASHSTIAKPHSDNSLPVDLDRGHSFTSPFCFSLKQSWPNLRSSIPLTPTRLLDIPHSIHHAIKDHAFDVRVRSSLASLSRRKLQKEAKKIPG